MTAWQPLKLLRNRRSLRWFLGGVSTLFLSAWLALKLVPLPPALLRPPVQSISLVDRYGITLRDTRVQERFSREFALADVPPHVVHAILAAEDKRFFFHHGIDGLATGRALAGILRHGHATSGGSTITQQLIKLAAPRPRSLRTKLIESVTALRLEQLWTKDQILAAYLNRLDFGNLNVGLAMAADYYFEKPVADLSDAEAAFLAGLPKNPRRLNPHTAASAARQRQETVLRRMCDNGWLTAAQRERAVAEPLRLQAPRRLFRAPHFVDLVLQQLPAPRPEVRTTLDFRLNEVVEHIIRERLARLRDQNVRNAAAVVIDNASGDVIALVGSENYFAPGAGQVNGAWARRSAGSTLKPFTYLLALERGATPASVVADVHTAFPAPDGFYRPENYNRRCYGPVRYRVALASSLNIPAVKTLIAAGGPAALHEAPPRRCGLTTLDKPPETYGLGLTLGNCEARLLELTNAYACLARLGEYRPWRILADAPTSKRAPSPARNSSGKSPISSATTPRALCLSACIRRCVSISPSPAKPGRAVIFAITGRSASRPNSPSEYGSETSTAHPCARSPASQARAQSCMMSSSICTRNSVDPWYATPAQIVERDVHPLTGKLLAQSQPRSIREGFVRDRLPPPESPGDYDADGQVKLGSEYTEWLASAESSLAGRVTNPGQLRTAGRLAPGGQRLCYRSRRPHQPQGSAGGQRASRYALGMPLARMPGWR